MSLSLFQQLSSVRLWFVFTTDDTVNCPAGKYLLGDICKPCPPDTYKADAGTQTCTPCHADQDGRPGKTAAIGQTSPDTCYIVSIICNI